MGYLNTVAIKFKLTQKGNKVSPMTGLSIFLDKILTWHWGRIQPKSCEERQQCSILKKSMIQVKTSQKTRSRVKRLPLPPSDHSLVNFK
jgi:hypothetical protein